METTPELTAEGLAIVRVLSTVLDRLVAANAPIALADPGQITKFHGMKAPGTAIQQYLERYEDNSCCTVFQKLCNIIVSYQHVLFVFLYMATQLFFLQDPQVCLMLK